MTTIIAGMFDTIDKAEGAMGKLLCAGFRARDVCSFANNPPGQHATLMTSGDEDEDLGVAHADSDACKSAAMGLGAGAATVAGPPGVAVGAGIGPYVGSPVGAPHGLDGLGTEEDPMRRPAGIVVAVRIEDGNAEQPAIAILNTHGVIWSMTSSGR